MFEFSVELKSSDSQQVASLFKGYRVTLVLKRAQNIGVPGGSSQDIEVSAEISSVVGDEGRTVMVLPVEQKQIHSDTILRVFSRDGRLVDERIIKRKEFPSSMVITLPERNTPKISGVQAGSAPRPVKIRGRVIDRKGQKQVAGKQIIIWGRDRNSDSAQRPLLATITDAQGYFSAEDPGYVLEEANATVSGGGPFPIRLLDDGSIDKRILLVIDTEKIPCGDNGAKAKDNCGCEVPVPRLPDVEDMINSPGTYSVDLSGDCPRLTKPNRTLEEFDFYTVVRTTDPAIKGLTVDNSRTIDVETVARIANPKLIGYLQPKGEFGQLHHEITPKEVPAMESPGRGKSAAASTSRGKDAKRKSKPEPVTAQSDSNPRPPSHSAEDWLDGTERNAVHGDAKVDLLILKSLVEQRSGITFQDLAKIDQESRVKELMRIVNAMKRTAAGRSELDGSNQIDWDDDPTFYQATQIAHGHLLHFKQEWIADGYSLGDLLYSLPLAPGQKKNIAVIDWERRETAARTESLTAEEKLASTLVRDRDISEIASAMASEKINGTSSASINSTAVGFGFGAFADGVGAIIGVAGGESSSESAAFQESARQAASSSLQQLRDSTIQAASAVRSQRSTVVQTVSQGETARFETETVANYNHCHALSMEYFEVLRHFVVNNRLLEVQECLFVPLMMSSFDVAKALRWQSILSRALRVRRLLPAFDAVHRIAHHYAGTDFPQARYADELLRHLEGSLKISFRFSRPADNDDDSFNAANWTGIRRLTGITGAEFWQKYIKAEKEKDKAFNDRLGAKLANELVKRMRFYAVDENDRSVLLPIDATIVSEYRTDKPAVVSLRLKSPLGKTVKLARKSVRGIKITMELAQDGKQGAQRVLLSDLLAPGSRTVVESGRISYRTDHFESELFNLSQIDNELGAFDDVLISTPLTVPELRNPREEDKQLKTQLLEHLNADIEYYHRAIWSNMDAQRRFMLLDGIMAPNSGGRSVASVVENRLIGIVGNSMVLPVVPGIHLDTSYSLDPENRLDLTSAYQPNIPPPPMRISVPTKGVFAEAVLGTCNSCETKDESKFWRWEESPIPDSPTQILPISTDTRRSDSPNLTAKDLPSPVVNIQNAPVAPDPQGFAPLLQLLSNPDLFRDVTGLSENQKNAVSALQSAFTAAQSFGSEAAKLAVQQNMVKDIDKMREVLKQGVDDGLITKEQASQKFLEAVDKLGGGDIGKQAGRITPEQVMKQSDKISQGGSLKFKDDKAQQEFVMTQSTFAPGDSASTNSAPTIELFDFNSPELTQFEQAMSFFPFDKSKAKTGVSRIKINIKNKEKGLVIFQEEENGKGEFGKVQIQNLDDIDDEVELLAAEPGICKITCRTFAAGVPLEVLTIGICCPLFIRITQENGEFDQFLEDFPTRDSNVRGLKDFIVSEMKRMAEYLLAPVNVRLIWQLSDDTSQNEKMPHVVKKFSTVLVRNRHQLIRAFGNTEFQPDTMIGFTGSPFTVCSHPASIQTFDRGIQIWPGTLKFGRSIPGREPEMSLRMQEIFDEFNAIQESDPDKIQNTAMILGRVLGNAIAHEIGHLAVKECYQIEDAQGQIQLDAHSHIDGDLMQDGLARRFEDITGIVIPQQSMVDFPATGTFDDMGIEKSAKFTNEPDQVILPNGEKQDEGSWNKILKYLPIPPFGPGVNKTNA
ncbi:MAG: hypothetical protein K2Y39_13580 [Candidatus Obscuribacterales bacterium]|nr:hypothetical protein [Candidatus Obscuribacterales bacterium]